MRAILSADCSTFTLAGRVWREKSPVSELPAKLAFYRKLAARKAGAYAHNFQPTISALEKIEARLKEGATACGA